MNQNIKNNQGERHGGLPENLEKLEDPTPDSGVDDHQRFLRGKTGAIFGVCALIFAIFQLWMAAYSPLSSDVIRSLHLGFLMLLGFMVYPMFKKRTTTVPWYDWILALLAFALSFYHWVFETELLARAGEPNTMDLVIGTLVVILLFELCRRALGIALPLIAGIFLLYAFFGQYLPGVLSHRPYGYDQIIEQMFMGTEGIYGIPLNVSATYIFLFILFGAFLEQAGMIRLFNNVALGLVGHTTGGPAKVAVISSGLMGSISGSGVANVLTVGQFTIPLMKRFGYSGIFAGAVEATASMGGQIMPPVMGAVAFVMAETIDIPYYQVCVAAIIPALLYYLTAFCMVHFEAGRANLHGLPKENCPSAIQAIKNYWYLLLPLLALVFMLFHGFTPMYAGLAGLGLTAVLVLGSAIASTLGSLAFRFFFWIVVGLVAGGLFQTNWQLSTSIIVLVAILAIACLFFQHGRHTLNVVRISMVNGARQAITVGLACAIVGIIIGTLTLTGAATTFAGVILNVGKQSLFLSLFLTMLVCLLLGMGIPTIPNYIITSSIAAPALLQLGVPLIVSHMFVFYFGILADLTPPVALAALAASSIAKAPFMKIALKATQIAIAGFVIPYMAVYDPALMMQSSSWLAVVYVTVKAILAIILWGGCSIGYLRGHLNLLQRGLCCLAALALVVSAAWTDAVGFALTVLVFAWHSFDLMRKQH